MKGARLAIVRCCGAWKSRAARIKWQQRVLSLNLSMRKRSELGWHQSPFRQWGRRLGALTRSVAGDQTNTPCSAHGFIENGRPNALNEPLCFEQQTILSFKESCLLMSCCYVLLGIGKMPLLGVHHTGITLADLSSERAVVNRIPIQICQVHTNPQIRNPRCM